jgi:hypothetical protein
MAEDRLNHSAVGTFFAAGLVYVAKQPNRFTIGDAGQEFIDMLMYAAGDGQPGKAQ